jgi:hypothetical protein
MVRRCAVVQSCFLVPASENSFLVSPGRVHDDVVRSIAERVSQTQSRVAIVVTGLPLAGKKIVCQRAAGLADLVPYMHLSDATAGFLQLANTIATWFSYVEDEEVRHLANVVLEHLKKDRLSRAHDDCIDLVDLALTRGLRACFLVDRVQFLDEFSLSLLRECLHDRRSGRVRSLRRNSRTPLQSNHDEAHEPNEPGKVCFLCVHVSLYNWKSATDVVADIARNQASVHVPIVQLGEAEAEDLRTMFKDLSDMEVEDRWLDAYSEASGNCAGYFIERTAAIRLLSGKLWSQGKRPWAETTEDLVLHIPGGLVRTNRRLPVTQVSAEVAMRFTQVFDELPPIFQTTLKVLSVSTATGYYQLPQHILWEVLNDLFADGVENKRMQIVLDEMTKMCLIKVGSSGGRGLLSFQCPALADIAFDVSTPIQIQSICESLIERLNLHNDGNFMVFMVLANLHHLIGHDKAITQACWVEGYKLFQIESVGWPEKQVSKIMEFIDEEITASGCLTREVLGDTFQVTLPAKQIVGKLLPLLKVRMVISKGNLNGGFSQAIVARSTQVQCLLDLWAIVFPPSLGIFSMSLAFSMAHQMLRMQFCFGYLQGLLRKGTCRKWLSWKPSCLTTDSLAGRKILRTNENKYYSYRHLLQVTMKYN